MPVQLLQRVHLSCNPSPHQRNAILFFGSVYMSQVPGTNFSTALMRIFSLVFRVPPPTATEVTAAAHLITHGTFLAGEGRSAHCFLHSSGSYNFVLSQAWLCKCSFLYCCF